MTDHVPISIDVLITAVVPGIRIAAFPYYEEVTLSKLQSLY
jgi:hypothetical protein